MRTGIYVRVSTEEQAREGYSIRAQIEKLSDYARVKDWIIYDIYKDEGISGKSIEERPDINRLLKDIEDGKVTNVLVFKIDRLTRSTKNLIELVEFFNQKNCAFNSLNESIDTGSATGRMFIKIIGIFAEFERENMIERVKVGNERKAKEGYTLCSCTPSYGYRKVHGDKIQQVIPEEAEIVREAFRMYVQDKYTLTQIAHLLNIRGVPTKKDKKWNTKTIRLLLSNENYIGKVRYHMHNDVPDQVIDGHHDAIIDESTFYQAVERIGLLKKGRKTKHPKSDVYFTGIAVCSECETKLTPKRSYKRVNGEAKACYPVYRCLDGVKGLCKAHTCSHKKLEAAFEAYLENYADFTEVCDLEDENEKIEDFNAGIDAEIASTEDSIRKHKDRHQEIMELYVNQSIEFSVYQDMVKILKENLVTLDTRLAELREGKKAPVTVKKTDVAADLKKNWILLDNDGRLEFLQKFVKRIVVEKPKDRLSEAVVTEVAFHEIVE